MSIGTTRLLAAVALLSALLASEAIAARGYGLHLGRARLRRDGTVAVPVTLRTPQRVRVAALNFTVRFDTGAAELAHRGVTAGSALRRANADLASRADEKTGSVRVIALPEFRPDFASIEGARIATVYLRPRRAPKGVRRWAEQHLELREVVLADGEGRELRLGDAEKGSRR